MMDVESLLNDIFSKRREFWGLPMLVLRGSRGRALAGAKGCCLMTIFLSRLLYCSYFASRFMCLSINCMIK